MGAILYIAAKAGVVRFFVVGFGKLRYTDPKRGLHA